MTDEEVITKFRKDLKAALYALCKEPSVTYDDPRILRTVMDALPPQPNPWKVRMGPELTPDECRMGKCRSIEVTWSAPVARCTTDEVARSTVTKGA